MIATVHYCITKNLEIMKTMNFEQMETINGGGPGLSCLWGLAQMGLVLGVASGMSMTGVGTIAAISTISSFISSAYAIGSECGAWLKSQM